MTHPPLAEMRARFESGATRSYEWRRQQLLQLKDALLRHEQDIYEALYADLKKNPEECWVTEIGFVLSELNFALRNLKRWMRPKRVRTNLLNLPSRSRIHAEPMGVVLIIGPWNYPLQLLIAPLVGALAAGNCALLKPSEVAPATAALVERLVAATFSPTEVSVVQGEGAAVIPTLMQGFRFDHVFYTGSTAVGRLIYQLAADQLVPVTLELGGKSPCVVEADANLRIAARRIALTKFSNAGQMCVAPDFLLVHRSVADALLQELKGAIGSFYNSQSVRDYHYGKIINERQYQRLLLYLQEGTVVYGGGTDAAAHFIEPTLLTDLRPNARVLQEEIFGPVLPILTWERREEAEALIARQGDPLAFYIFTEDKRKAQQWIERVPFGGGCINNASWHLTNPRLPFGGRGPSGTGRYHGRFSFDTFSHKKSILDTPTWFDPDIKYPPFKGKLKWFRRIIR